MKARLVALLLALACAAGAAAAQFHHSAAAPATPVAEVGDPGSVGDETWGWYDMQKVPPL